MRRILVTCSMIFIQHGKTIEERQKSMATMLNLTPASAEEFENQTVVRISAGEETDVPDWCSETKTWELAENDGSLKELVRKPNVQVKQSMSPPLAEAIRDQEKLGLDGDGPTGVKRVRKN